MAIAIGPNKIITGLNKSIEARCLKRFNFVLAEIPRLNKRDVKWTNDENKGSGRIKSARMRLGSRPHLSLPQQDTPYLTQMKRAPSHLSRLGQRLASERLMQKQKEGKAGRKMLQQFRRTLQ